jgi:2-methylisocitrate lyase-like PEP mutase family enzyme
MHHNFAQFNALHKADEPLLVFNVWDVQSAKLFERCGAKVIATSSGAVAQTLGYPDGEQMSFSEYLYIIERISKSVSIPFSVDLESGYGKSVDEIVENIEALVKLGVAGINIEDSIVVRGKRQLADADMFAAKLGQISERLQKANTKIFVNVRSDIFLLGAESSVEEGKRRSAMYGRAGANGLFFPGLISEMEIRSIVSNTDLPVNLISSARLSEIPQLQQLGVRRISMGPFLNQFAYKKLEEVTTKILKERKLSHLFPDPGK